MKALGIIQKQGHWMLYELKQRDVERRLVTCEQLLQRQKIKGFRIESWPAMKSGYTTITISVEDHGLSPVMYQHRRRSRMFMIRSVCSAFGGICWVQFIMSSSNRPKLSWHITIDYCWCVRTELWRQNGHYYTIRDTIKWFCSMTIPGRML